MEGRALCLFMASKESSDLTRVICPSDLDDDDDDDDDDNEDDKDEDGGELAIDDNDTEIDDDLKRRDVLRSPWLVPALPEAPARPAPPPASKSRGSAWPFSTILFRSARGDSPKPSGLL